MTTTTVTKKVDQKVPPGALMSIRIELAGNGGASVSYGHAPEEKKGSSKSNDCCPTWQPRRPDVYASLDEALEAIKATSSGEKKAS